MDIEIVKEKDTPLLSRKRVTAWVNSTGTTPSRKDLVKPVAAKLKVPEDTVSIRHIYTRHGEQRVKLIIHVYKDAETLKRLEGEGLVKKHEQPAKEEKPAEEAPKVEKAAETPEEEKPAEKAKEEPAEKPEDKKAAEEPEADKKKVEEAAPKEEKPAEETKDNPAEKEEDKKEAE